MYNLAEYLKGSDMTYTDDIITQAVEIYGCSCDSCCEQTPLAIAECTKRKHAIVEDAKHDTPQAWRKAFIVWNKEHDGDIDKYQLSDMEWSLDCFVAGIKYVQRV